MNFVKRAVAAVVVILASGNVASYAEIDVFHKNTSDSILSKECANYAATIDKSAVEMLKYIK